MRVIYTFKHIPDRNYFNNPFFLEVAKLSVVQANKFYDTELFCDTASKEYFKNNEVPFGKITVLQSLEDYKGKLFGVAKMLTCIEQKDGYIHIDLDTILLDQVMPLNSVTFGYYDENYSKLKNYVFSPDIRSMYINTFEYRLKNFIDPDTYLKWNWKIFPNCSLLGVNDYLGVARMYTEVLDLFDPVLYFSDNEAKLSAFLEQFMLGEQLTRYRVEHGSICDTNPLLDIDHGNIDDIFKFKFIHLQGYLGNQTLARKIIRRIVQHNEEKQKAKTNIKTSLI